MKIDIYTDTYKPEINGVTTALSVLKSSLKAKGHFVRVYAPKPKKSTIVEDNVYRLSAVVISKQIEQKLALPFFSKHLKQALFTDADVVHAHTLGMMAFFGLIVARRKHIPYVFTYHTMLTEYTHYVGKNVVRPWMVEKVSRFYCNLADHVITPAYKMESELKRWGVVTPISMVPNGLTISEFKGDSNYLIKRGFVGAGDDVLVYIGRLAKEKNIEFLIRTFPKILESNPKAKLVIVGGGPYLVKLKRYAKGKTGIIFTGLIDPSEVANCYVSAKMFVFSSTSEVHPMCIVEALASGLPLVALKDEALSSMIINGYNGYLVNNQAQFVAGVSELLRNDQKAKEFGRNSFLLATREYSAESFVRRHEEIYLGLLKLQKPEVRIGLGDRDFLISRARAAFISLAVFVVVTAFFAFNSPADIKAAPGEIVSKVKSSEIATRSAQIVRNSVDRVENVAGRVKEIGD